ncbi:hypothetical protein LINGRAHAP2_LOCUS24554, partial [Linum grandiflorum]
SSTPASSHLSSISKSRKAYASIIVKFSTLLQLSSTMATSKEDSQALQLVVTSSEAESQLSALVYGSLSFTQTSLLLPSKPERGPIFTTFLSHTKSLLSIATV